MNSVFALESGGRELLEARAAELELEREGTEAWAKMAGTPAGRAIAKSLNERIQAVRAFYSAIPAHHQHAPLLLVGAQERERELSSILELLVNAQNALKSIDKERVAIVEALHRVEESQEPKGGFVSERVSQEE